MTHNINNTVLIADTPTVNGRTYPLEEVKREVEKLQALIDGFSPPFGENADNPSCMDDIITDVSNISHLIKRVWMEGNAVKADVEILNTPEGKIITESLKSGVKFKLTPRGTGMVDDNTVVTDYNLVTIDIIREE